VHLEIQLAKLNTRRLVVEEGRDKQNLPSLVQLTLARLTQRLLPMQVQLMPDRHSLVLLILDRLMLQLLILAMLTQELLLIES